MGAVGGGGGGGAGALGGGGGGGGPLDVVVDWSQVLSLGEQQRLAFARLLLARPRLALLDEATSALDTDNEARLYQARRGGARPLCSLGLGGAQRCRGEAVQGRGAAARLRQPKSLRPHLAAGAHVRTHTRRAITPKPPRAQAVAAAGVTAVSVAHRPGLARFHSRVLRLEPADTGGGGGGGPSWAVVSAEQYAAEAAAAAAAAVAPRARG
jgi:hypothetical protein